MERFKLTPAVHLFLMKDGNILLQRRINTGYEDGNYGVPSGHLDGNESVSAAMSREIKEEIGLDIPFTDLQVVHIDHRLKDDERVDFFFIAKQWTGEPKILEPDKSDDLQWFPLGELPENFIPYVRSALNNYQNNIFFSEVGWPERNS